MKFPSAAPPRSLDTTPTRIISTGAGVTVVLVLLITALGWGMSRSSRTATTDHLQLWRSIDRLDYVNEVLTMSSLMVAATGDAAWEARYRRFEPEVGTLLAEILQRAPEVGQQDAAARARVAADTLLALEELAFRWIREGDRAAAAELLASPAYERQKEIYSGAVGQITAVLRARIEAHRNSLRWKRLLLGLFSAASVLVLAGMWLFLRRLIRRHLEERARAEAQVRQSEQRFRAMVEHGHDIITLIDAKGVIRYDSPSIERVLGHAPEERVGGSILDLVHPDDRPGVLALLAQGLEHPERAFALELRVRHKDGSWRWLESTGSNTLDDPAVRGSVISSRDITERKTAEEDRERTLSLLHATLESTADGILVVDTQGHIRNYNRRFQQLWRIPDKLMRERDDDALIAYVSDQLEDPEAFSTRAKALRTLEDPSFDVLAFKDGRVFECYSRPQRIGEEVVGRVFSFRDVTEQRRAAQALQASERRHRTMLQAVPDLIFRFTRTGELLDFQAPDDRDLYAPLEQIRGRNIRDLLPPDIAEKILTHTEQADASGTVESFEYALPMPNGVQNFEARVAQSGPEEVLAVVRNVTDRKEAEAREHHLIRETVAREQAEAAQERIQGILESITDGFFALDEQWRFTFLNGQVERLSGIRREDLLGRNIWEALSLGTESRSRSEFRRVVEEQVPVEFEESDPLRDLWLRVRAYPHEEGLVAYVRDVTERKRMEEALRRGEERFRNIVENMGEAVIITDLEERVLYANPRVEEIFGYSPDEIRGNIASEVLMSPEERTMQKERLRRRAEGVSERYEMLHRRKDGSRIWVEIAGVPFRDRDDEITGTLGVVRDITERKQAEEALHESQIAMEAVLAASPDIIEMMDLEGRLQWVSPAMQDVLGYPADELSGRPMHTLLAEEDREAFDSSLCRLVDGDVEEVRVRYAARHRDGRWVRMEGHGRAIRNEVMRGLVLVARDVTEQEQLIDALRAATEAAEAASRAKSELLSRTSHELRTPLNAILGFGQLLEVDLQRPEDQESVEQILRAGRHLLSLVDEVLDIAHAESGRLDLSTEPVPVHGLIEEALAMVRPLAQARSVALRSMADPCDRVVLADRQRLTQIVLNLLANAIKYNPEGGSVEVGCRESEEGRLRIEVRDTGPGIEPEKLGRLFRPFERAGAEQSGVEGAGLGLALSKALIEAMHGSIGAESTPGAGSTFWIELPLDSAQVEPGQAESSELDLPTDETAGRAPVVLYVEDNPANVRLVERILRRARPDVQLITAMQGKLGLDLAREHQPDLVLLDLNLPDISGEQVLRTLREEETTREIPVVMISGNALPAQVEKLRSMGASDYITKPFQVSHFLAVLDEALQIS